MAANVHHDAAPLIAGLVFNVNAGDLEAVRPRYNQLGEGGQAVDGAFDRGGLDGGACVGDVQRIGFVFAERGIGRAADALNLERLGVGRGGRLRREGHAGLTLNARHKPAHHRRQAGGVAASGGIHHEIRIDRERSGCGRHGDGHGHEGGLGREGRHAGAGQQRDNFN